MSQQKRHTPKEVIDRVYKMLDQGCDNKTIMARTGLTPSTLKRKKSAWRKARAAKSGGA